MAGVEAELLEVVLAGFFEFALEGEGFGEVDVDQFLLEYDTDRSGGFEPLRFMPRGKTVVLGLVSSKFPELESPDQLLRGIDGASEIPFSGLPVKVPG